MGSLRNPLVLEVAEELRRGGHSVFDDWHAAAPDADDHWRQYHLLRGDSYGEALRAPMAQQIYRFDKSWLNWADAGVLLLPAGRSAFWEIGRFEGQGKPTYVLVGEEPERWDVMLAGATGVYYDVRDLLTELDA